MLADPTSGISLRLNALLCFSHRVGVGHKALTVVHLHLWQSLAIHDLIISDDAIQVQNIRHERVDLRQLQ